MPKLMMINFEGKIQVARLKITSSSELFRTQHSQAYLRASQSSEELRRQCDPGRRNGIRWPVVAVLVLGGVMKLNSHFLEKIRIHLVQKFGNRGVKWSGCNIKRTAAIQETPAVTRLDIYRLNTG